MPQGIAVVLTLQAEKHWLGPLIAISHAAKISMLRVFVQR